MQTFRKLPTRKPQQRRHRVRANAGGTASARRLHWPGSGRAPTAGHGDRRRWPDRARTASRRDRRGSADSYPCVPRRVSTASMMSIASSCVEALQPARVRSQGSSDCAAATTARATRCDVRLRRASPRRAGAASWAHPAFGRALEPLRRGPVVAQVPVVDEPEILHVLPLVRLRREPLLQQRDREVGTAGAARIRLAEEDRAEAVGDAEVRIERGRQIEQRVQQRVVLTWLGGASRSVPKCCSARIQ